MRTVPRERANRRPDAPARKPGEFQAKRAKRQVQAAIYTRLNEACKLAQETGTAIVVVGGKRFILTRDEQGDGYYTTRVMVRLKRWGIVYALLNDKDSGCLNVLFPVRKTIHGVNSFAWDSIAAYVARIEDVETGADLGLGW